MGIVPYSILFRTTYEQFQRNYIWKQASVSRLLCRMVRPLQNDETHIGRTKKYDW